MILYGDVLCSLRQDWRCNRLVDILKIIKNEEGIFAKRLTGRILYSIYSEGQIDSRGVLIS